MTPERRAELRGIANENIDRGFGRVPVLGSAEMIELLDLLDPPARQIRRIKKDKTAINRARAQQNWVTHDKHAEVLCEEG